jgi:hypothetical protein
MKDEKTETQDHRKKEQQKGQKDINTQKQKRQELQKTYHKQQTMKENRTTPTLKQKIFLHYVKDVS